MKTKHNTKTIAVVLPLLLCSSRVIPENSKLYPWGKDWAATSSIALIAWPEVYPSAGEPFTFIEVYILKRLMLSGPYTRFNVINCVIGAISSPFLTLIFFNDSIFVRSEKSDWTITRYNLPNLLKFEVYIPPKYPCKVVKISSGLNPAFLHCATSISTIYCGKLGLKDVCALAISGRFSKSAKKFLATS